MNTFPNTEHGLAFVAIAFAGFVAARAWTHGVLKMFWAIMGLAVGAGFGFLCFQNANALLTRIAPGKELGLVANIAVSFIVALIAYIIFRQLAKTILQKVFNPEGVLSGWAFGFRGAVMSLIPSVITILVVGLGIRMGGTMLELRRAEKKCRADKDYLTDHYPGWPSITKIRDGFERLPFVLDVYQPIDPISRRPERQLVMLLITTKKPALFSHLEKNAATEALIAGPLFQSLMVEKEVRDLLTENKHTVLLRHPKILNATSVDSFAREVAKIDLHQIIDDFMLSEKRQAMLQSQKRQEVPDF